MSYLSDATEEYLRDKAPVVCACEHGFQDAQEVRTQIALSGFQFQHSHAHEAITDDVTIICLPLFLEVLGP